ncbi:MAG: Wzz/FepE/Etk N-terminal domain-containing protein [Desulfomicrobium sp.]|nr:Wzz/FepE/Etk N-terminal domain-containing protein [Desulfomicrobium sp.]
MNQDQLTVRSVPDDEIDLFELAQNIWREKVLVIIISGLCTLMALIYALWATPIYQGTSVLKPAQIKDLDELNNIGIYTLTPDEALTRVGASLESYALRFEFFKQNQKLFAELIKDNYSFEQNFERINEKAIKILRPDEKKQESFSRFVSLQFEYPRGVDGPAIVNGLVRQAIDSERDHLNADLEVIIANKLMLINQQLEALRSGYHTEKDAQIASLSEEDKLKELKLKDELTAIRQSLQTRRENRITQLDEAMGIAESLGIKKPTTPSSLDDAKIPATGSLIKTEVTNQEWPLYFMGTEALQAEKDALLSRKSDDFTSGRIVEIQQELKILEHNRRIEVLKQRENEDLFLAELADLQREIARLKNIKVNMKDLHLVRIDQQATQAAQAVKPKRKLIVAIGLVAGSMLGVLAALIRVAVLNRRQERT